jgi:hypothetical protein
MKKDDLLERVRVQLEEKIAEHAVLMADEARLSITAATCKNKTWRIKSATDRRRVSERLERLNAELIGLALLLPTAPTANRAA